MKQLILILILSYSANISSAQESFPFEARMEWLTIGVFSNGGYPEISSEDTQYTTGSDTIINDINYYKLFENQEYLAAVRKQNDKVRIVKKDTNLELPLYDFSHDLENGDIVYSTSQYSDSTAYTVSYLELQNVNGQEILFYTLSGASGSFQVIEGIGGVESGFFPKEYLLAELMYHIECMYVQDIDYSLYYTLITDCSLLMDTNEIPNDFISIYPNPIFNNLIIESKDIDISKISIFDINGVKEYEYDTSNEKNSGIIQITDLDIPSGFYFLNIETDNGLSTVRKISKI